jgi:[ribosomal protein S5]-alanine N-acetyltransferase
MSERLPSDGVIALRPWTGADAPEIVACVDGDEDIARWLDQVPQPYSLADAKTYIAGIGEQAYAVTDAESGRVLGSIGLRWNEIESHRGQVSSTRPVPGQHSNVAEVGYWVREDARGRGTATRALALVATVAFEQGAARVQLRAAVGNTASRRVAEKAGFTLEGVLRSAHWSPRLQERLDWAMYSLLPDDR